MERVFVSWNVPNLVTVNLMAWAGFLLFILLYQFVGKRAGSSAGSSAPTSAGADEIAGLGY